MTHSLDPDTSEEFKNFCEPSLRALLKCQKIREPSLADWHSDFGCVHRVALLGVWAEWENRDWTPAVAGSNAQLDLPILLTCTLRFLEMDKPEGSQWEQYFRLMVAIGNILVEHAQDAEAKEELTLLRHAIVKKLDEIQTNHGSDISYIQHTYNRDAMAFDLPIHANGGT